MPQFQIAQRVISMLSRLSGRAKLGRAPAAGCIGLDVGSSSVKGVKIRKSVDSLTLLQWLTVPVSPQADSAQRAQAIRQLLKELDRHGDPVVTAMGGPGVVLRSVLLPKMTPEELRNSLTFEAEKHIPFKLSEACLDFSIGPDHPGGRMEVLLAAARKELLEEHLALLASAGVTPDAIDLEALALANAWEAGLSPRGGSPASGEPEVVGLIHVGARGTILDFFFDSALKFTREISIGGASFTQTLAQGLQVDAPEAERIKCDPRERSAQVRAILQPRWEEWLSQCQASFDFYENQYSQKVKRLGLSGGAARSAGFREWIQEATGTPVEEWNPVGRLEVTGDPRPLETQRIGLGVAIGLAVRGLS